MPTWEKKTQFPPFSAANPGHKDIDTKKEKAKLIQSPSRGPRAKKSKSKGKA